MATTTHSLLHSSSAGSGSSGGHYHARAFSGSSPLVAQIQTRVLFREGRERACVTTSCVPSSRVKQILRTVLTLAPMKDVSSDLLRVDVHRPDPGRYQHDYGLALAVALVSSLTRKRHRDDLLFVGDVDLDGRVQDVGSKKVDRLNEALAKFEIETPLAIVCSPATATWLNSASTVRVLPAETLAAAVAAVWPGISLKPF